MGIVFQTNRRWANGVTLVIWATFMLSSIASMQEGAFAGGEQEEGLQPAKLKYNSIRRFVERHATAPDVSIRGIQRDSTGSQLFIQFSINDPKSHELNKRAVAIVSGRDVRIVIEESTVVWYDDNAQPAVQLKDDQYAFPNGQSIPVKDPEQPDPFAAYSSPSGSLLMAHFPGDSGWSIVDVAMPSQKLVRLPPERRPRCAYALTNAIIVFASGLGPVNCLVYRASPSGYVLAEEFPLPWAAMVQDMDTRNGVVLIHGRGDLFASCYQFDVRTRKKKRMGLEPAWCFFLQPEVIGTLRRGGLHSEVRLEPIPPPDTTYKSQL